MEMDIGMRAKKFLLIVLRYIGRILLFSLGASVLALLSFIFTGGLTSVSLSDRIFWAGMIFMMGAVVLVIAISSAGLGQGLPNMIRRPEEARDLMEKNLKVREAMEKRYDLCILLWLAGMGCIGISVLVQVYSPWK